ncbi:cupin domain-containing protein [Leucobacter japonicus]|uniref:cupin domain-containing protein n=1 Tax=Leucobacter japonicus TaxID=1461259 RepID=UPI0006A79928|nr:cupin domain-containing protein [Leucobacter japonicus]
MTESPQPADSETDVADASGSRGDVQLETELFRVTRWTIAPGGAIPEHRHDFPYVVVPLVTGTMHVVNADGSEIQADLEFGVSYTRPAGAVHRVENRGSDADIVFVETERLA